MASHAVTVMIYFTKFVEVGYGVIVAPVQKVTVHSVSSGGTVAPLCGVGSVLQNI